MRLLDKASSRRESSHPVKFRRPPKLRLFERPLYAIVLTPMLLAMEFLRSVFPVLEADSFGGAVCPSLQPQPSRQRLAN